MSDRVKLAREIAARTTTRFIEIKREPRRLARGTTAAHFIEIKRERGGGRVPFTEERLNEIRGGLTAEEYRWKLILAWREP